MKLKVCIISILFCLIGNSSAKNLDSNKVKLDLSEHPGALCNRECVAGDTRICHFHFFLENYHTVGPACGDCLRGNITHCFNIQCVTGDGLERGVMSTNRQIPGPPIHVCHNDKLVIDVTNAMGGTATTLHWHGFLQKETPWMDGVPFLTQCPLEFGNTFRYFFTATDPGTQFYHGHTGHHKVNGLYGSIIVRKDQNSTLNQKHYDRDLPEHAILAADWMDDLGEHFMPGLPHHPTNINPTNVLINGKGVKIDLNTRRAKTRVPIEVFRVDAGLRYRFRFINAGSHHCPMMIEVEDHPLLVITSDSIDFHPVNASSIVSQSGERYDFVINANQGRNKYNYWMRVRLLGACQAMKIEQYALLSYAPKSIDSKELSAPDVAFPAYENDFDRRSYFNHPNTTCSDPNGEDHCITDVIPYFERPSFLDGEPDHKFYVGFLNRRMDAKQIFAPGNYGGFMNIRENLMFAATLNNISLAAPPYSLLTQSEMIKEQMFCNVDNLPKHCQPGQFCRCTHRVKVKKDSIVEVVLIDEENNINSINHPFHLHGYYFQVVGMGQHPDGIPMTVELAKQMEKTRSLPRYYAQSNPTLKDTISIPSKGYAIIRFKASNPGLWLLHCHFEWHSAIGMGMILQVGEHEDWVPPPKDFKRCNEFKPELFVDNLRNNKIEL